MSHFQLKPVEAPWEDYGRILYHGMSMHQKRDAGRIRLERTGPEIFPITFPFEIVVTQSLRAELERSGLRGFTFVPVVNFHIVEFDWSAWDVTEEEPPEYPDSGEPEDLILARPHSESAARALGNLWELVPENIPGADLYFLPKTTIPCLSEAAVQWFERHVGDYVSITLRA